MRFSVRPAVADDAAALRPLLPRLADFELPPGRNPDHLWRGDERVLLRALAGEAPDTFCFLAETDAHETVGVAMVTMRPELLSGEPSAHLEALAVSQSTEGQGVARALTNAVEVEAAARGARSMTLHVFARNERARKFYQKLGFDEELIRATKAL